MRELPTGGIVVAVCMGEERGGPKKPVEDGARLKRDLGVVDDAEAQKQSLLQVRMLSEEGIIDAGGEIDPGAFGENILTRGIDLSGIEHGTVLRIGDAAAQLTWQAPRLKKYRRYGDDVVMSEIFAAHGVFLTVLKTGLVRPGDRISILIDDGLD